MLKYNFMSQGMIVDYGYEHQPSLPEVRRTNSALDFSDDVLWASRWLVTQAYEAPQPIFTIMPNAEHVAANGLHISRGLDREYARYRGGRLARTVMFTGFDISDFGSPFSSMKITRTYAPQSESSNNETIYSFASNRLEFQGEPSGKGAMDYVSLLHRVGGIRPDTLRGMRSPWPNGHLSSFARRQAGPVSLYLEQPEPKPTLADIENKLPNSLLREVVWCLRFAGEACVGPLVEAPAK
jgi:hypothetical protein